MRPDFRLIKTPKLQWPDHKRSYLVKNKYLLSLLLFCSILTSLMAAYYSLVDGGFVHSNMAASVFIDSKDKLQEDPFPSGHDSLNEVANGRIHRPLIVLLPIFLHNIAGIPYADLIFYPIIGILLPFSAFLVARKLLNSDFYGFLFGIYVAFEAQALVRNYNMNIQGYGFFFYFLIIFVSLSLLIKRDDGSTSNNHPYRRDKNRSLYLYIVLFLLIVANVYSYYTTEFYTAVFLMLLSAGIYLSRYFSYLGRYFSSTGPLFFKHNFAITAFLIAAIILIVYEDGFVSSPNSYVSRIQKGYVSPIESLNDFIKDSLSALNIGTSVNDNESSSSSVVSTSRELVYVNLTLLLIILSSIPLLFFTARRRMPLSVFLVCSIIIITAVLDVATYLALVGDVDLKYVYFVLPIVTLAFVRFNPSNTTFKWLFIAGLFFLLIVRFAIYVDEWQQQKDLLRTAELYDYQFIAKTGEENVFALDDGELVQVFSVVTDNRAAGKLLFVSGLANNAEHSLARQYESVDTIGFLYNGSKSSLEDMRRTYGDNVLITRYSMNEEFAGQGWRQFPPISNLTQAYNTPGTNLVYNGEDVILIKLPPADVQNRLGVIR
jgi:hypothetical protein